MKQAKFAPRTPFAQELNARVERYFTENKLSPFASPSMIHKSIFIVLLFCASYGMLVFGKPTLISGILLTFLLSQSMVMIGFSIMHDSNHGSYSKFSKINRLLGFSLDFMGANSLVWCQKHNFLHHSYTNINGIDDDIQTAGFIRLSPQQPWKPHFRFQALYAPFLYAILTMYWFLLNDFIQFFQRKIGPYKVRGIDNRATWIFIGFKLIYFTYMFVIPLQFHSWQHVVIAYIAINLIAGFTISVIFQLAHTLDSNSFPEPDNNGKISQDFAEHQLATTSDFSANNRFLTWYLGGLNYQIEHHLFPKICHVHYPEIAPIVAQTCTEFGVPYRNKSTFSQAISTHFRFLHNMGNPRKQE